MIIDNNNKIEYDNAQMFNSNSLCTVNTNTNIINDIPPTLYLDEKIKVIHFILNETYIPIRIPIAVSDFIENLRIVYHPLNVIKVINMFFK